MINKLKRIAATHPETRPYLIPIIKRYASADYNKPKMDRVVDAFTRFLIGDPAIGLRQLATLGNPEVKPELYDMGEYNKMSKQIYLLLFAGIRGELSSWGVTFNKTKLAYVVDNFVRFLIGDPNDGLQGLKRIGNPRSE